MRTDLFRALVNDLDVRLDSLDLLAASSLGLSPEEADTFAREAAITQALARIHVEHPELSDADLAELRSALRAQRRP